jgi:hypothetical protein
MVSGRFEIIKLLYIHTDIYFSYYSPVMFYDDDAVLSHFERCSAPRPPQFNKNLNLVEPPTKTRWGRREGGSKKIFPLRPLPPPVNKNVQNMFRFCNTIYCNEFKQIFIQV